MDERALKIFKTFLKNGTLKKEDDFTLWNDFENEEVKDQLYTMGTILDFQIILPRMDIAYLIPNQENELISESSFDFKKSIGSETRQIDVYLLQYLGIYLIYEFFHGEETNPKVREFITKNEFIKIFTEYCERIIRTPELTEENERQYGVNFMKLAEVWCGKISGEDPTTRKIDTKYGCLNRILFKLKDEKLFVEESDMIKPTRKLEDLMPYFLAKSRIQEINALLKED